MSGASPGGRGARLLEHAVPPAVTALGLGLVLLGAWRSTSAAPEMALGPLTLSGRWGPRLVVLGIGLLVGRLLLLGGPAGVPGPTGRLLARVPPAARFVGGAFLAYEAAIKLFDFLSLLWVAHRERPLTSVAALWVQPLCRDWDAAWYQSIAFEGYRSDGGLANVAFFPLYPLLIRGAALIVGDPCWAAWLVSQGALLGALAGLHRLSRARLGDEDAARWTLVLLLAWPFAFFYAAGYTEPLFLCLAVWAFLCAERGRYWIAGVLGALAAATRLTGLALLPALLLVPPAREPGAAPLSLRELGRRLAPRRLPVLLVPAGTLAYFTFLKVRFGDFWANLHAAREGWGRGPAKGGHDLFAATTALFQPDQDPLRLVLTVQLVLGLALLPLLRRLPRAHGWGYTLFVLGIVLPGVFSGLEGLGRYLAPAFPLAWIAAAAASKQPARAALAVLLMGLFQALFLFLHAHGYWVT
jgi:hypothetical protein